MLFCNFIVYLLRISLIYVALVFAKSICSDDDYMLIETLTKYNRKCQTSLISSTNMALKLAS